MQCLRAVHALALPQGMIAAGFIRNLVWDHLHGHEVPTPLEDVDVVFFEANDLSLPPEQRFEAELTALLPGVSWQVRNQARMHLSHGVPAYASAMDAVQRFPETATCIGVALDAAGEIHFPVDAGLEDAWALRLSENPRCFTKGFSQRLRDKKWSEKWPMLELPDGE